MHPRFDHVARSVKLPTESRAAALETLERFATEVMGKVAA